MTQLVTGDAVVLGLQPARVPSRAMALAIDLVIVFAAYLLAAVLLQSSVMPLGTAVSSAVQVALLVLMLVGLPVAIETLSQGRSPGKAVFGLRVVRDDGGPIRFRHAFVRGAIGLIEIVMTAGSVACVASLVSARGRRLGDVFAGTLVVRERIPAESAVPLPPPPPELADRFARLDLSAVPEGLWLAVRQFLARIPRMDAALVWPTAARLSAELVSRTGTPAPPGIHPVAYLTALAGERRRREELRVFGPAGAPGHGRPGTAAAVAAAPPPPPGAVSGAAPEPAYRARPAQSGSGFTPPS